MGGRLDKVNFDKNVGVKVSTPVPAVTVGVKLFLYINKNHATQM